MTAFVAPKPVERLEISAHSSQVTDPVATAGRTEMAVRIADRGKRHARANSIGMPVIYIARGILCVAGVAHVPVLFGESQPEKARTIGSGEVAAKTKKRDRPKGTATPVVELIVRRGALRRFDKLKQATGDLPVNVSWDKRRRDRRLSGNVTERERRRTERRKQPPFTWEVADFVLVEKPVPLGQRAKSTTKQRPKHQRRQP
jgi:hypothetical protein